MFSCPKLLPSRCSGSHYFHHFGTLLLDCDMPLVSLWTVSSLKTELSSCTSMSSLDQRQCLAHTASAQIFVDKRWGFKISWSYLTHPSSLHPTATHQILPICPSHFYFFKFFLSKSTIVIQALQVTSTESSCLLFLTTFSPSSNLPSTWTNILISPLPDLRTSNGFSLPKRSQPVPSPTSTLRTFYSGQIFPDLLPTVLPPSKSPFQLLFLPKSYPSLKAHVKCHVLGQPVIILQPRGDYVPFSVPNY